MYCIRRVSDCLVWYRSLDAQWRGRPSECRGVCSRSEMSDASNTPRERLNDYVKVETDAAGDGGVDAVFESCDGGVDAVIIKAAGRHG